MTQPADANLDERRAPQDIYGRPHDKQWNNQSHRWEDKKMRDTPQVADLSMFAELEKLRAEIAFIKREKEELEQEAARMSTLYIEACGGRRDFRNAFREQRDEFRKVVDALAQRDATIKAVREYLKGPASTWIYAERILALIDKEQA